MMLLLLLLALVFYYNGKSVVCHPHFPYLPPLLFPPSLLVVMIHSQVILENNILLKGFLKCL